MVMTMSDVEEMSIVELNNYCLKHNKNIIIHKGKMVGFSNDLGV